MPVLAASARPLLWASPIGVGNLAVNETLYGFAGSTPAPTTRSRPRGAVWSARQFVKLEATGSNPVGVAEGRLAESGRLHLF